MRIQLGVVVGKHSPLKGAYSWAACGKGESQVMRNLRREKGSPIRLSCWVACGKGEQRVKELVGLPVVIFLYSYFVIKAHKFYYVF
jgi:hypothetical protein